MRGKKLLVIALVFVMVLSLAACGGRPGAGGADGEEFTLRIGHVIDETAPTHRGALVFAEYVERESGGRISVEIFPNSLLGGDMALVEGVQLGTVEMVLPAMTVLTNIDPRFGIGDMPFLWTSAQSGFQAFDNELGAYLDQVIMDEVGAVNLGYLFNSVRALSNSVRPVTTIDDMQGLNIRIMESPVYIDMFETMGANVTPMAFGEVFTALQQGVIDGQDNGAPLTYSMRFFEVQDYFTELGHAMSFLTILMNTDFYNSLPADLREIIHRAALVFVEAQRQYQLEERGIALEAMEAAGVTVSQITPAEHARFVQAVQGTYERFSDTIPPELVALATMYN